MKKQKQKPRSMFSDTGSLKDIIALQYKMKTRGSLNENLGDGALLKFNPLYKNARAEALRQGIKFKVPKGGSFYAWPLLNLDTMVETKQINYFDNFSGFVELEKKRPGFFTIFNLKIPPHPNSILHESAHLIVSGLARERINKTKLPKTKNPQAARVFPFLLSESCANALEFMAGGDCFDPVINFLFDQNSYLSSGHSRAVGLTLLKFFSKDVVFRFMVFAYVFSNFLKENATDAELESLLKIAHGEVGVRLRPEAKRALRGGFKLALSLNPAFRRQTSETYFHALGFDGDIHSLVRATNAELLGMCRGSLPLVDAFVRQVILPERSSK